MFNYFILNSCNFICDIMLNALNLKFKQIPNNIPMAVCMQRPFLMSKLTLLE